MACDDVFSGVGRESCDAGRVGVGGVGREGGSLCEACRGGNGLGEVVREYCAGALGRVTEAVIESRRVALKHSGAGKEMIEEFCGVERSGSVLAKEEERS